MGQSSVDGGLSRHREASPVDPDVSRWESPRARGSQTAVCYTRMENETVPGTTCAGRTSEVSNGWDRSSEGGADESECGLGALAGVEVGVEVGAECFGRFEFEEPGVDSDGLLGPLAGLDLLRSEGAEEVFGAFAVLSGLCGFGAPAADETESSLNGGG
ncbi:UNVERIFIED_CONTAM: hypothetical protein K2H54_054743 [Gekko kuhli]